MKEDLDLHVQRQMFDKLNQVSPSFCLAKWKQVTLHLHNGFNHSCHHVKSHQIPLKNLDTNPELLHNTPFKMKVRKQMLNGVRPAECSYCWAFEDQGRLSDRSFKSSDPWAADYFDESVLKGAKEAIFPSHVEVSFENTCNLKCMYCGPQFSTKWTEEAEKYGAYPTSDNHGSIKDLKREGRVSFSKDNNPYIKAFWHWWPRLKPNLRVLRVTGGEPLLSAQTWRLFDELNQNPNQTLQFAVNSNMSLSEPIISKLIEKINRLEGKVGRFTLYTSVDTAGDQAEYIRYGLNFELYRKNVERVLSEVKWPIEVNFMLTVNALSISKLKNLLSIISEQKKLYPRHNVEFDTPILRHPLHMSVRILPEQFQEKIQDALDFMKANSEGAAGFQDWQIQRIDRILSVMKNEPYHPTELNLRRKDFYLMYKEYDRRRGTNFLKTFPEYSDFYNQCEQLVEPS